MLTSTPSRSHRSAARTTLVVLLLLVVVGVLLGVGYAVTHGSSHPRAALPITVATSVTTAAAITTTASPVTPAPTTLPPDVVRFVALPVGMPPTPGASETNYPWHRLVATLTGPTKVQAGDSLDYRVRLTNRTAEAIPLSPCPAYDLSVGLRTMSYGLNCTDAPTSVIGPGGSLSFDLPVSISRSLGSGTRTDVAWSLGWQPDRTSPQARLTVTVH